MFSRTFESALRIDDRARVNNFVEPQLRDSRFLIFLGMHCRRHDTITVHYLSYHQTSYVGYCEIPIRIRFVVTPIKWFTSLINWWSELVKISFYTSLKSFALFSRLTTVEFNDSRNSLDHVIAYFPLETDCCQHRCVSSDLFSFQEKWSSVFNEVVPNFVSPNFAKH